MKHYQISIVSKNKKSLEDFITFVYNKLKITNKYFQKKKQRKILTILKSPHVNKKAQEQFNSNLYYKTINVYLPQYLKLIRFIKTIKSNLFLDVHIKVKLIINQRLEKKINKTVFNPTNFKLNCLINNKVKYCNSKKKISSNILLTKNKNFKKKITNYNYFSNIKTFLKIMDIYGELFKKEIVKLDPIFK